MELQKDLEFVRSAVMELESYLTAGSAYQLLLPGLPRLTLGTLRLALARLEGLMDDRSRAEAQRLRSETEHLCQRWLANTRQKARQELPERISTWTAYLKDLSDDPAEAAFEYPGRVRDRAMITLLSQDIEAGFELQRRIDAADDLLRQFFVPGGFIWQTECAPAFPPEVFWFLYGNVPGR